MTEVTLSTDLLKKSASNVRAGHTKDDIKMMAASIKNRGIINPPSVAMNGDGKYEIVAGQLRVAGAIAAGLEEILCIDITDMTPEQRVDLSLSENVHRRQMSEIELYVAFDKLFKSGMSVQEIGARFDKTEREIQQTLAIGCLPKKLLDAAERGDVGDRTLRCLAIAPKGEIRRYLKLKVDDRPRDWQIQEWLAGADGMYPAKSAIFDLELYKGGQFTDLFADEDEVWLTDGSQFMELQTAAIDAKLEEFEKKGWKIQQVEHWQDWAYERIAKKKGGKVIWATNPRNGSVEFHVGYRRIAKSGAAPKAKGSKAKPEAKPETSKAFDDYCAELRHNAVKAHMVTNKKAGLIAATALLIKQCDNISIAASGGKVKADGYIDSLNAQPDKDAIMDAAATMFDELNIGDGGLWQLDLGDLIAKLEEMPTAALNRYIITVMATNWEVGFDPKYSDTMGKGLHIHGVDNVILDDGFWNGITNKQTLIKIAKENDIPIDENATLKVIRAVIKDKVPESWLPDWLCFE